LRRRRRPKDRGPNRRRNPTAAAQGIDIVIGGPDNSGILAGSTHFEYQNVPPDISAKVARITDIRTGTTSPSRQQRCSSRLLTRHGRSHPRRQ
jgi:hypothetical protein